VPGILHTRDHHAALVGDHHQRQPQPVQEAAVYLHEVAALDELARVDVRGLVHQSSIE
jgi:hypothetical protein